MASGASPSDPWEELKPAIEQLYMSEKKKLSEVAAIMKRDHRFDAGESQYKYHFKKWGWKRSLSGKKKAAVVAELQTRALIGKSSSSVTHQGRAVDTKKIRRHLKECARQANGVQLTFSNRIFLKWNMPYAAMQELHARSSNQGHTLPFSVPTPASDIDVATPSASAASPLGAPSPTTTIVKKKTAMDRARLFFAGRHDQLISSMNKRERIIMSEWLYQYWYYGFKTAKAWGRGPRNWTAASLRFDDFRVLARNSSPGTPGGTANSPSTLSQDIARPSDLCRWLIHVPYSDDHYTPFDGNASLESSDPTPDPNDESTWDDWPTAWQGPPLNTRLRNALEHNDFSTIKSEDLPVAIPRIAAAAKTSASELLEESLGFAIMSRNVDLTRDTIQKILRAEVDVDSLYPLHLAITYLDGSKSCCDILRLLLDSYTKNNFSTNELGHTVLDSLMIAIMKSHSSIAPHELDESLRNLTRFPGEEVDICGRWDADSDCIRQLYASGKPSVPLQWKHKFCHTSVQAVCHCIMLLCIKGRLDTLSGLYLRHCFGCGLKLQFHPLHTFVLTAFHLACSGCEGEDLFGMIACLLCLIACGLSPRATAPLSVSSLFNRGDLEDHCDHEEMSPQELSQRLSMMSLEYSWSHQVQIGWRLFCTILSICTNNWTPKDNDGCEPDSRDDFIGISPPDGLLRESHFEEHYIGVSAAFGERKDIASLWAAVQVEILTYRRLDEGSNWLSRYFDMEEVLRNLERGYPALTKLSEEGLLKTHCRCGWFSPNYWLISTLEDTTTEYIANLDVWQRATYSVLPEEW